MAGAVVSFGIKKLWDLLSRESERLQGVDEEVDKLKRELRRLQSLLEDAYAKKHDSKRLGNFLEDVKDIVYDAEDIIESFLLNENRREEKGIKKRVKRFACFFVVRREFASNVERVTKSISELIGEMQNLGIQQLIDGGRSMSLQDRQREKREIRQTFPNSAESDFVGMERSVDELVVQLKGGDNLISISGMGGIGKTTLARQVFHHDTVRCLFDGFAWVCVSQQFTRMLIWQRILKELQPNDNMDEYTLHAKLFQLLQNGRYLLVLDDVWTKEDWDLIKPVFPAKRGWKMLLTSRNESVGLHVDPSCFAFRPRHLTPEESWKLCESIVFTRKNEIEFKVDEELEALGKKMVAYCGGLPLAIRVLGGLLAKKHTVSDWKRVYENIGAQIVGKFGVDDSSPNSVNQVLSLSYEELPVQLKHCFLYLAHFPEDTKIGVENLFYCWAADGILTSYYHALTIRNSGEDYLEELVRRNMVMAEKSYVNSRFESCQMHDMMREVCLSKAKEENFLQVVNDATTPTSIINAQSDPTRSRRIAVHGYDAFKIFGRKNKEKVRSVLLCGDKYVFLLQPDFQSLPLLRVLDLSRVKFLGWELPSSIGDLIHLRFLSLEEAWVTHLPSSVRNLKLLLYLNLRVIDGFVHLPNVLKEMVELRYLYLPPSMDDKIKLELGDLVNLESLANFSTKHTNVTDLCRMVKLRDLKVKLEGGCTYETLSSSLIELRNLETLSIKNYSSRDHKGEFFLDLIHLKELTLMIRLPRLPAQQRLPPQLAYICLGGCMMKEDPMPILEKLRHLKSVRLSLDAFVGGRMVCSKGGFPQLCDLYIFYEEKLEEWIVEEGSMPCLHTLTIRYCKKLKELPDGLKYIASLKELKIQDMKKEWKKRLVAGGEDYYKVQHIPTLQFIDCNID